MNTVTDIDILPAAIAAVVQSFIDNMGPAAMDAAAMSGQCQTVSMALARALDGMVADGETVDAWADQIWTNEVPAELADDPNAPGHYVCRVKHDGLTYDIDSTCAQFGALFTGPRVIEHW